jgi:hypothetical protein
VIAGSHHKQHFFPGCVQKGEDLVHCSVLMVLNVVVRDLLELA